MAAHRYWRLRFPETYASDTKLVSLSELEMKSTAGGADLTTGKTAFASAFYNTDTPSKMIDDVTGTTASIWSTFQQGQPAGGHFIGVDFGSGGDVDIVEFTLTSTIYGENPKRIHVEWSDDFTTWNLAWYIGSVPTWTNNETKTFNISTGSTTPQFWRVRAPSTYSSGYFGVAELELRATNGGADLTSGKTIFASTFLGGFEPTKAIDNNSATFWTTGGTAPPTGGHWLTVDFSSSNATIVEFTLQVRPDGFREDPSSIYLEVSTTEITWTSVIYETSIATWTAGQTKVFNNLPVPGRVHQNSLRIVNTADASARVHQNSLRIVNKADASARVHQNSLRIVNKADADARVHQVSLRVICSVEDYVEITRPSSFFVI